MALVFYTDSGRLSRKDPTRVQCGISRGGKLTLTAHFLFHSMSPMLKQHLEQRHIDLDSGRSGLALEREYWQALEVLA